MLLDVWLSRQNLDLATAPVVNMEPVNWFKKGGAFLAAKFFEKIREELLIKNNARRVSCETPAGRSFMEHPATTQG